MTVSGLFHTLICKNCKKLFDNSSEASPNIDYQYCTMCGVKLARLWDIVFDPKKVAIDQAIELFIEKWHEIESHPDPTEFQAGYQAACKIIMEAICQEEKEQ